MRRSLTAATVPWLLCLACRSSATRSGVLDVGDASIHYVVAGRGRPVVLIHGWALSLREWADQIPALSTQYRVVAYDRRGYGKSTGFADPTADPGDLARLLDALHIPSATLVGHSAGADIATRFATAMPRRVDGLVLYGGGEPAGFPVADDRPLPDMKAFARQHGVDSLLRLVLSLPAFAPGPTRTPAMAARLDSMIAEYSGRDLLEDHPESGTFGRAEFSVMTRWRMPTLFISGDREFPRWQLMADSMVRWMPNARRVTIPGGGHGVSFDQPERFNAALLGFLGQIAAAR